MDNKNTRVILIILLVVLGSVLACICLSTLGVGGLFSLALQEPEEVKVTLDVPVSANFDEQIIFRVEVENLSDSVQSLDSIDIYNSYLEGLVVIDVEPDFSDVDMYDNFGESYTSYAFDQEISPRQSIIVEFSLLAVNTGDYSGEIDVCINAVYICKSLIVRTVVK